jgi:hypothetical protein
MSDSHKPGFVSAIVLDIKDEIYSNLVISRRWFHLGVMSFIDESFVFIDLAELSLDSVVPLSVTIILINRHCLVICLWYFLAIFVLRCTVVGHKFGLVDHTSELPLTLSN